MAGRGFVAAATIAALAGVSACAKTPLQAPTLQEARDHPFPEEQLRRDIRGLVTDPSLNHAQFAVAVVSLKTGELLYSLNSFRLLMPASNQKLVTTAVAASTLGWDFRYTTRLFATGPVAADGTLQGDLIVVGDGDPTINPRHPLRWAAFDDWAGQLAAKGISRIAGRVIGDDNAFAEPGLGLGWVWDDLAYGYGSPVGALQYNENEVAVLVSPGPQAGARAEIDLSPPGSGLSIDADVATVAAGEPTRLSLERSPDSRLLHVRGQIATGAKPTTESAGVPNPTQMYVDVLRAALVRHGIAVSGPAVDIDDLAAPPQISGSALLLEDRSPLLSEIIGTTLKWSRNGYAETLLWTLAPARPATAEAGLQVVRDTLTRWGIAPDDYLARDGSGLSRYDWITADTLTWLLSYIHLDPALSEPFKLTLPVAGGAGSLENRLKGTPAQGRVLAKTGSMSQVRALSGYLTTLDGEPVAFSFIVNGFRVPTRQIDEVFDKVLVKLVEFTHARVDTPRS